MRSDTVKNLYLIRFILLFFVIIEVVNLNISGIDLIIPNIILITIYFWGIYSEDDVLSQSYLLILSVFGEILKGEIIGTSTLPYLFLFSLIKSQRRFFVNKPFMVTWVGFLLFALAAFLIKIIILSLLYQKIFYEKYLFIQLLLTILLYPGIHWFFYNIRLFLFKI